MMVSNRNLLFQGAMLVSGRVHFTRAYRGLKNVQAGLWNTKMAKANPIVDVISEHDDPTVFVWKMLNFNLEWEVTAQATSFPDTQTVLHDTATW